MTLNSFCEAMLTSPSLMNQLTNTKEWVKLLLVEVNSFQCLSDDTVDWLAGRATGLINTCTFYSPRLISWTTGRRK